MSEPKPPHPGHDDPDHELQDAEISRLYQQLSHPKPSAETDEEILTVARRVVDAPFYERFIGWRSGLATAAVLVLLVGLLRAWSGGHGHKMEESPMAEASPAAAAPASSTIAQYSAPPAAAPAAAPAPVPAQVGEAPAVAAAPAAKAAAPVLAKKEEAAPEAQEEMDNAVPPAEVAAAPAPKPLSRLSASSSNAVAAAPSRAAAAPAPLVDSAVAGAMLQHEPSVHELMLQGRYDAAYAKSITTPGSGPWARLDSDLLGLITGKPTDQRCMNNTADSVVNDACTLLRDYREGKTLNPEDVRAIGIAIKRYSPEHQYWYGGLQDLLKR